MSIEAGIDNSTIIKSRGSNDKFEEAFSTILSDISSLVVPREGLAEQSSSISSMQKWLKFAVEYNVPHGKKFRGRMVELTYTVLMENGNNDKIKSARQLGWIVEILQAAFLVADDIMDNGEKRRGQACWHRLRGVGENVALNDAFLLENLAFKLLEKYFGDSSIYAELVKLFHKVTFNTILGQSMDVRNDGSCHKFEQYSESLYNFIVTYKTAYYTFYLPIALGMLLADVPQTKRSLWENVEKISMQLGALFQIQDDFMDNFGEEWVTGKVGTDIQEGKCTWLFIQAKQLCSPEEWSKLQENYGSADEDRVNAVKELYIKLNLQEIFFETVKQIRDAICADIDKMEHNKLMLVFRKTLLVIYDRSC